LSGGSVKTAATRQDRGLSETKTFNKAGGLSPVLEPLLPLNAVNGAALVDLILQTHSICFYIKIYIHPEWIMLLFAGCN
jgi:hypothetical protein